MIYVALLRGINVGGNNKVDMKRLKETFERTGMASVTTYINSGNVVFTHESLGTTELASKLEAAVEKDFGISVKVLVRDIRDIRTIAQVLPDSWNNDDAMKCDVIFLWESIAGAEVVAELPVRPGIDEVKYTAGAILWCVNRQNVTKSGLAKIVGTQLYKQMTIRNCNTVRKLLELMTTKES
jgi:uncharacterized protein (DUF1697 family)